MDMNMGWFGRRKAKPRRGFYRGTQDPANKAPRRWKRRLFIAAMFLIMVACLSPQIPAEKSEETIDTNQLARESIYAQFPFEVENKEASEKLREAAAAQVPEAFRVNVDRVNEQLNQLRLQIDALRAQREGIEQAVRQALLRSTSAQDENEVTRQAIVSHAQALLQQAEFQGVQDPAALAAWLMPLPQSVPKREFAAAPADENPAVSRQTLRLIAPSGPAFEFANIDYLAEVAEQGLRNVLSYGVLSLKERESPAIGPEKLIILRDAPVEGQTLREEIALIQAPTPARAKQQLAARIAEKIKESPAAASASPTDVQTLERAALELARANVADTLSFYPEETERQREKARAEVKPVLRTYQREEQIQERGKPWTPQSKLAYETHQKLKEQRGDKTKNVFAVAVAHAALAGLALFCLLRFMPFMDRKPQEDVFLKVALALLIMAGTLVAARVISYFDIKGLTVPIAAGSILLAILTNVRVAMLASLLTSLLVSVIFYYNWNVLAVGFAMSLAGAAGISVVRRRSDMTGAAITATAAGMATMAAIILATGSVGMDTGLRDLTLILMNGVACLFLVPGLLSPLERVSGITTDIQLLEYSDLNNEVLSRLAIEVPATYAHSLMLGQLAEAAADAIGANGLLAQVCAYYHDIGKLRRPEYFIENQTGANIHEELSPRLSARAIASHVVEGVELAKEFHLPKPIVSGILEHHGTCLIGFFYQQALNQQRHDDIAESDFRYPGPKPQTPETAILMICDAAESGVRSIKNPNEERVREFVDKIIAARAQDRQFDECDLTLRNLDTIAEVVSHRIMVSMHTRIAYPERLDKRTGAPVAAREGTEK